MKIKFEVEFEDGEKLVAEDKFTSDEQNPKEFFERVILECLDSDTYVNGDDEKVAYVMNSFAEQGKSIRDFVSNGFQEDFEWIVDHYWHEILKFGMEDVADVDLF